MSNDKNMEINQAVLMSYINAELSDEKNKEVEFWMTINSENQKQFDDLKKTWELAQNVKPKPVAVDVNKAWQSVESKITAKIVDIEPKRNWFKPLMAVAAMLTVIFLGYKFMNNPVQQQVELVSDFTIIEQTLIDGSQIALNENSSLIYPEAFDKTERRVKLNGEAFFDIERNEKKPFIIDLPNQNYVKVLGTSFNINTNKNDSLTEVYVSSGKVEFGTADNKIILVKGEKGIMNNKTKVVYKSVEVESDRTNLFWKSKTLKFKNESLTDVVNTLNSVFEVDIKISCENKTNALTTNKFKGVDVEFILEVLAETHGLNITKISKSQYILDCSEN